MLVVLAGIEVTGVFVGVTVDGAVSAVTFVLAESIVDDSEF